MHSQLWHDQSQLKGCAQLQSSTNVQEDTIEQKDYLLLGQHQ